ncbi:MAG: metallophosphoesterase, partial [Enterococcus malodoratus]
KLYVNTGLGTTSIHARFGVPPEISVFELHF